MNNDTSQLNYEQQSQLIDKLKQEIDELKEKVESEYQMVRGLTVDKFELESQLKAKSDMCDKLAADLKWFCDRVDNKEIRSMRTYARFKNSLTQYNQTK